MSNLILIPENLLALRNVAVLAGSEASASMADDNLLTESPSEFWRSTDNKPANVTVVLQAAANTAVQADTFALIGHNLYRGDQWRVALYETIGGYSTLAPNGTVSTTNVSCPSGAANSHLDVDDAFSPDANWITPTVPGTAWVARWTTTNPATPKTGANLQSIWVWAKSTSAVSYGSVAPTLKCEIFETGGGTALADLGTKTISSTTGQWVFFPWDASILADPDGSEVEIQLTGSGRDLRYTPTTKKDCSVGSVVWHHEAATLLPTTSPTRDSGWKTVAPFSGSGVTYYPEVSGIASADHHQFSTSVAAYPLAVLMIRSDYAPTDFAPLAETLPVPPGYVQAGSVILGQRFSPACDRDFGPLVSTKDYSSKSRTYGGQRFGSRRFVQRILSLPLNWLTPAEAHTLFDRILWRQGILKPIFVSILPGDSTEEKHTSFLASLRNPENAMVATTTRGKSRAMTLEFEEEL